MAISLKKIARDILGADKEIRFLALTTVQRLVSSSIETVEDLVPVREALVKLTTDADMDLAYVARQGLNHVDALLREMGASSAIPSPGTAGAAPAPLDRAQVLAGLDVETDPLRLASLLSTFKEIRDPAAGTKVVKLLKHSDARVRANAVEAIETIAEPKTLLVLLAPMLADTNHRVKANAARALGRMGHPKVVETLGEMMVSNRLPMREAAVFAISHLMGDAYLDMLLKAVQDPYLPIRVRAIQGLGIHGLPRALPILQALRNDIEIDVCEAAHKAILAIQGKATRGGELINLEAIASPEESAPPAPSSEQAPAPPAATGPDTGEGQPLSASPAPPSPPRPAPGSLSGVLEGMRAAAQQELAGIEKALERKTMPRIAFKGASPEQLAALLHETRLEVGRQVQKHIRGGVVNHSDLQPLFYDLLKYVDLLRRRQESTADSPGSAPSLMGFLRDKLGTKKDDDPVKKLAEKVDQTLDGLGRKALTLIRAGTIDFANAKELSEREDQLAKELEIISAKPH